MFGFIFDTHHGPHLYSTMHHHRFRIFGAARQLPDSRRLVDFRTGRHKVTSQRDDHMIKKMVVHSPTTVSTNI